MTTEKKEATKAFLKALSSLFLGLGNVEAFIYIKATTFPLDLQPVKVVFGSKNGFIHYYDYPKHYKYLGGRDKPLCPNIISRQLYILR